MRLRNHAALPHFSRGPLGRRLLKPGLKSAQKSELTLPKNPGSGKAGEVLLGVGSAGIQFGKALGACVIAVVSKPERASEIRGLGADHFVALSAGPLAKAVQKLTEGNGADLVLASVGGEVTGQAFSAVSKFGRLVHLGYSAGMTLTINSLDFVRNAPTILGFNIFLQTPKRSGKDHDEVLALAAAKKYRAFVD